MNTCQKIVAAIILSGLAANVFAATEAAAKKKPVEGTQGYRDEMNRPPEPWKGPPRSGAQVYTQSCATCHARTTQGAPLPDDDVEWRLRTEKGMDVLMAHVTNGYKELMPARGGCRNCSDAELKAAVLFILNQSGISPDSISSKK